MRLGPAPSALESSADAPHLAPMETFCIAIDDGRGPQNYEMELPSVGAAKEELTRIFGEMISNGVTEFWAARDWRISVSKAGMPLFVLRASALQLDGPVGAVQ
jgi:hypothetical protein